tara:strand:+ start:2917 stop:4302 length:1386 start_codon:yes stop_codon:yes gene_type:complete
MTVQDLPPNFDRLINRFINSDLSELEFEELQQYLIAHPQARQTYFDHLDIAIGIPKSNVERLKQLDQFVTSDIYPGQSATGSPAVRRKSKLFSAFRYLAVATAAVAIMYSIEWYMTGHTFLRKASVTASTVDLPYVATLSRANDCIWGADNPPLFSGQRLLSKELYLEKGIAEFRFDSGVRLVLEGPTRINIDSANCATVDSGSVVLHGYESAPEFELITPQARFFDIGTEYGTKVEEDGSTELHVFQGEVRILPRGTTSGNHIEDQILIAGEARHIDKKGKADIALKPENFKREVPEKPKDLKLVREELIAYDSFHPAKIRDPEETSDWRQAGTGWKNIWRQGINDAKPAKGSSHPRKTLQAELLNPHQAGCLELDRGKNAWRSLQQPIRLDIDAIYYISFFIEKKSGPKTSGNQYGNFSLQTVDQEDSKKKDPVRNHFGKLSDLAYQSSACSESAAAAG